MAADFVSGSGAGLGATEDEAVEADGGRDIRFVGDLARAGACSETRFEAGISVTSPSSEYVTKEWAGMELFR